MARPLTAAMSNDLAWRLGKVAAEAGSPARRDVGDYIDRGLILRRLLDEAGFDLIARSEAPSPTADRFFLMEIETRHFTFRATGRTRDECRAVMRAAWERHCQQTGADPAWLDGDIRDTEPMIVTVPGATRDGSAI